MTRTAPRPRRVLALSSGGGHWVQLQRLAPAFDDCETHFACTDPAQAATVPNRPFYVFADANKDQKLRLILCTLQLIVILLRVRPHVIVTTGAAGGLIAIALGKLMGARGLFVDSIANARELSISARLALRTAEAVFTQWPGVAAITPARFRGSVL